MPITAKSKGGSGGDSGRALASKSEGSGFDPRPGHSSFFDCSAIVGCCPDRGSSSVAVMGFSSLVDAPRARALAQVEAAFTKSTAHASTKLDGPSNRELYGRGCHWPFTA